MIIETLKQLDERTGYWAGVLATYAVLSVGIALWYFYW